MTQRPPRSTRSDTRLPYTTLVRSLRRADERLDAADEPVGAVGVDPEQVAGGQPRIAALEQGAQRTVGVGAVAVAELGQQHADLADGSLLGEPVVALDQPAGVHVVAGDLQRGAPIG